MGLKEMTNITQDKNGEFDILNSLLEAYRKWGFLVDMNDWKEFDIQDTDALTYEDEEKETFTTQR